MYKITRKQTSKTSRILKHLVFNSYEAARAAARKWVRKNFEPGLRMSMDGSESETQYYNPALTSYGINISKI